MRVVLDVTEGPGEGRQFSFERHDVFLVGRSPRCHFSVGGDLDCSRVHMLMVLSPPICQLRDLGSTNGTYVNGEPVREAVLNDGDVVTAGQTAIRVTVEGDDHERPVRAEPVEQTEMPEPEAVDASSPDPEFSHAIHIDEDAQAEPDVEDDADEGEVLRFDDPDDADDVEDAGGAIVFEDVEDEHGQGAGGPLRCARCGREASAGSIAGQRSAADSVYVCARCREQANEQGGPIPGYRLLRRLGEGGMGVVWLAEAAADGRQVAVKTMIPEIAASRQMVRRFLRESEISLQLRHENIVEFLDAGETRGQLYIVMEYVDGIDAEQAREQQGGRLPPNDVVRIGLQTLDALAHAHGQSVIHRDIKPPNMLLVGRAPAWQVKVTDFGLARNCRAAGLSRLTRPGEVLGSLPYMPPEQVLDCAHADARADLFSLAATMYHLLTGQFIYDFRPRQQDPMITVIEDDVVPIERRGVSVPRTVAQVIERALRKEMNERYQSAAEMRNALGGGGW